MERFPRTPPAAATQASLRRLRPALLVSACAPLIGAATIAAASTTYPDFDHATQFLSELGSAKSPNPNLFNLGIFLTGLMAMMCGVTFALALRQITGRWIVAAICLLCFGIGGAGIVCSTIYVWPDPRHLAINLGLCVQLVPIALLAAFRKDPSMRGLVQFLGLTLLLMITFTVLTKHLLLKGLVHPGNVGWWERGFALVLSAWVSVTAIVLADRIKHMTDTRPDSWLDLTSRRS